MPGLEEDKTVWRYEISDAGRFERAKVKELGRGVKITVGKVKGSERWEIQNYIFDKRLFKTPEIVRQRLDKHLKSQISLLTDFKAWNEYRRRAINAYVEISNVK